MNLALQLSAAQASRAGKSNRGRVKGAGGNYREPNTHEKYKELLLNQERTVADIAEKLGYTHQGVAGTLQRYRRLGLVKFVREVKGREGRPAKVYTWVTC